jgi:stage II sporulation protein D
MKLAPDEKLRIWWDSRGEADPNMEYRVQVSHPLALPEAEALMKRLRVVGERPDRVKVPDADTWRVLTGHFSSTAAAEPVLQKLQDLGLDELWVSSESRTVPPPRAGPSTPSRITTSAAPFPSPACGSAPPGN